MLPLARLIDREDFCADIVLGILGHTVFHPVLLLSLALAARLAGKGHGFSDLHPWAYATLIVLTSLSVVARASAYLTNRARNNWVDDAYDWSKEIVLVTGGAEGIGGSIVRLLDGKGITVVVLDIRPMSFTTSSRVHHFFCDVRSPTRVGAAADAVKVKVGDPTVIINNAGVLRSKGILSAEPDDVRLTFDVNALSHFWVAKAFLPSMTRRNHGMVVTVSSLAAWIGVPGMVNYSASKAACAMFSEGLAAELVALYEAPKVRIVSVHLNHTKTALAEGLSLGFPKFLAPPLEPDYVAQAVVKQVLSGRSAQIVIPRWAAALRTFPEWLRAPIRSGTMKNAVVNLVGREFVGDLSAPRVE